MTQVLVSDADIRRAWRDTSKTVVVQAQGLGLSASTLRLRAMALGLPKRSAVRRAALADAAPVVALLEQGLQVPQIAAQLGVSLHQVKWAVQRHGLRTNGKCKIAGLRAKALARAWVGGVSTDEIARVFGVTVSGARRAAARLGLDPRPMRGAAAVRLTMADFLIAERARRYARATAVAQAAARAADREVAHAGAAAARSGVAA